MVLRGSSSARGAATLCLLLLVAAASFARGDGAASRAASGGTQSGYGGSPRGRPPFGAGKPKLPQPSADPVAITVEGAVRGVYERSRLGRTFAAFRGVPYAEPPVGGRRFKEPIPKKRWTGVLNTTNFESPCLQYNFIFGPDQERVIGEEDCLFVNIYTPQLPSSRNKPGLDVLVYIHGGVFMYGTPNLYGPRFLMDKDIILVTVAYRLGVLGFLSTEDEVVPGNNGLKDQSLALKWIKQNIAAFGGNPNSITITGMSAGGTSVHYHYLSPYSKGLFARGMAFSGTSLVPWGTAYDHRSKAIKLGELVGCHTPHSHDLVSCLRARSARHIVEQTKHFQVWRYNPVNPFGPISPEPGNAPFLPKHPVDIIIDGEAQDLPWLTSVTTEEGIYPAGEFITKDDALKQLDEDFDYIAPHILLYNYSVPKGQQDEVSEKIRKFYLQDRKISSKTRKEVIKMIGDRIFVVDVERGARLMAKYNKQPVYFYEFAYRGANSISDFMSRTKIDLGVAHEDDTGYILDMTHFDTESTAADRSVIALMTDICANFAKSGDPTPTNKNVQWYPVKANSKDMDYLRIDSSTKMEMRSSPDLGNRIFWDSLPINETQILAYKRIQNS